MGDTAGEIGDGHHQGVAIHLDADERPGLRIEPVEAGPAAAARFLFAQIGQVAVFQQLLDDAGNLGDAGSQFFGKVGQAESRSFVAKGEDGFFFCGIMPVDIVEECTHGYKNKYNRA